MSFADLPPQPPLRTPDGERYSRNMAVRSAPILDGESGDLLDLPYGDDYWQKVDIFRPETGTGPWPIIVFAHGGSWIAGCKEWMAFMAPAIRALPAIFVSVSYRLAPAVRYPTIVEDCADALRFIHQQAQVIGADPDRIFVGGHSAGAHLMALLALSPDMLVARGLPRNTIKGCLAQSAPFDLRAGDGRDAEQLAQIHAILLNDAADAEAASPLMRPLGDSPPFLITVGDRDFPRIRAAAPLMRDALVDANVEVQFQDLPDHDHFETSERCVDEGHPWLSAVREMLSSTNVDRAPHA